MTPGQVSNVLLALQELARAQRMQERNHPEQAVESVKAARVILAELLRGYGIDPADLTE